MTIDNDKNKVYMCSIHSYIFIDKTDSYSAD